VADQGQARLDGIEDARGGLGVHLAVERHDHGAELPHGEQVDGGAPVIGDPQHDPVALPNAAGGELAGHQVGEVQELAAGQRLPGQTGLAADHRGRVALGALANDLVDMRQHGRCPPPTARW
jgi:hypothetical protein